MSLVTIFLDTQSGTPYPRSAGFDTDTFYLYLDGNVEIKELLERDRMAEEQELLERDRLVEEQCITDLRRQQDMEQQCTDALSREESTCNWADCVEVGSREIALEAAGHARVREAEFYYQLVKWVSRLEAEASVDHAGMERANARDQRALSHLWQVRGEAEDAVPAFSMYHRWRLTSSS